MMCSRPPHEQLCLPSRRARVVDAVSFYERNSKSADETRPMGRGNTKGAASQPQFDIQPSNGRT